MRVSELSLVEFDNIDTIVARMRFIYRLFYSHIKQNSNFFLITFAYLEIQSTYTNIYTHVVSAKRGD